MAAATTGRAQAVRMLLEKGADANVRTKKNDTALGDAATTGDEATVKLLLEHTKDVNVQDIRGYSPLLYAAGSDTMPAASVKMLLAKGANQDAKGDEETARMLAVKRGDSEVARLLGASEEDRKLPRRGPGSGRQRTVPFDRRGGQAGICASRDSRATTSFASGVAIPVTRRICHRLRLRWRETGGFRLRRSFRNFRLTCTGTMLSRCGLNTFGPAGVAWEMFDFGMNHTPRDEYTDSVVRYLKAMQLPEGDWLTIESRRPPMAAGRHQTAALAIYSLKQYGLPSQIKPIQTR